MKIAVSAESTVDLPKEILEEFDIKTLPFHVFLGNEDGLDGEITPTRIIEFVNQTGKLPKTGAVNRFQFEEHFATLKNDYDAVIHFSLSSELSSAYENAVAAASEFKNVYVVDSRSLSTGIALLCLYARKLADAGKDIKTIYEKSLERVLNVQASFVLKRLDYLYKGGRCSALALFGANILRLRVQILLKNGKMVPGKKYRGNFNHVAEKYVDDVLEQFGNPDLSEVFITYTTADDELIQIIRAKLIERGFKNVRTTHAGATITSHCGENCLGILFLNDGEHEES